ncbi:hypothetical protein ACLKA6_005934 [Drosophila palustris]
MGVKSNLYLICLIILLGVIMAEEESVTKADGTVVHKFVDRDGMAWEYEQKLLKFDNSLTPSIVKVFNGPWTPQTSIQQRIFNGNTADEGQFPYIVFLSITLRNGRSSFCGGSIIDNSWILTAAHCTDNARSIKIFFGTTRKGESQFSHTVGADHIVRHEDYDDETLENDVALIHTPRVKFSDVINKVKLADGDHDYEGSWAVASGWGDTSDDDDSPEDLQSAHLQVLSKDAYREKTKADIVLCTTSGEGVDIGEGDSGGPLVSVDDHKLIGVTSFNFNSLPACFARVSAFRDWIHDHTDHNSQRQQHFATRMRLQRRQRCINSSSSSSCPSSGRVNGSLQHLRSPFHLDIYDEANDVQQFQCPHTSSSSQV